MSYLLNTASCRPCGHGRTGPVMHDFLSRAGGRRSVDKKCIRIKTEGRPLLRSSPFSAQSLKPAQTTAGTRKTVKHAAWERTPLCATKAAAVLPSCQTLTSAFFVLSGSSDVAGCSGALDRLADHAGQHRPRLAGGPPAAHWSRHYTTGTDPPHMPGCLGACPAPPRSCHSPVRPWRRTCLLCYWQAPPCAAGRGCRLRGEPFCIVRHPAAGLAARERLAWYTCTGLCCSATHADALTSSWGESV